MRPRFASYVVPIVAAVACSGPILFTPGMPAYHHDWSLPFTTAAAADGAIAHLSTWDPAGLGHPNPFATANPVPLVLAGLALLVSPILAAKAMLLLALVIAGLGAARAARTAYDASDLAAAAVGLAYVASPYVVNELGAGHITLWFGYALLPWCFERAVAYEKGERGAAFGLALCAALSTIAPQFLVYDAVAVLAASLVTRATFAESTKALTIACGAALLALAPTLWAFVQSHGAVAIDVPPPLQSWEDAQSVKLPDALLLVHYIEPYGALAFGSYAWLPWIPIAVAAVGLVAWRSWPAAKGVLLLCLVGLAFVTGTQGPLAGLWRAAFDAVPASAAFRELYSAGTLISFAIAWGAGLCVHAARRQYAAMLFIAIVAATLPTLAGGVGKTVTNVEIPVSAQNTEAAVATLPAGRIVPLPLLTPIRVRGVAVGGVDAFAPSDDRHPSMTEYLASFPVTALASAGQPNDDSWRAFAEALGASGVVVRDDMVSAEAGRLHSTAAGIAGASPARVIALTPQPLVSFAAQLAPMPLSFDQMSGGVYLQSALGPLPPDGAGAAAVELPPPSRATDDPTRNWVDAERWRARTPDPSAAIAGGVFTESQRPLQLKLPAGGGWSILTSSVQALTIDGVKSTKAIAPSRYPQWTALTGLSDYIAVRPTGATVIYRLARGASNTPSEKYPAIAISAVTRPLPWRIDLTLRTPAKGPALLIFRDRYAPGWSVIGARAMWHGMADGYANAWLVDGPQTKITLYYAPQELFMWLCATVLLGYFMLALLTLRAAIAGRK
ncbi:MAG TPA: hypothetical protein VKT51_12175 [Candidatus Eremiobacteraceae bacterium]|nr:hypothetical protein [Candidatus Eremiobacteraceae bacterium]